MQRNTFCPGQVDIACLLMGRLHLRKKLLNDVSEYETVYKTVSLLSLWVINATY